MRAALDLFAEIALCFLLGAQSALRPSDDTSPDLMGMRIRMP